MERLHKDPASHQKENGVLCFPDFPFETCEYLPFIVTQYLWFYGRCKWSGLLEQKTGIYKKFIDL